MQKTEIQKEITEKENRRATEEEVLAILRIVAPGTNFRAALDGSLRTGKGALIVIENKHIHKLIDGGFKLNTKFTPQKLIELSKMDGAIILSGDMKNITHANVLLTPNSRIPSNETGTRHKAAERTAKQAGTLTVAISERRNVITLYYKNIRYTLVETEELLRKTNENIQLLEKQRELFDSQLERLNYIELLNLPNLKQALAVIQKGRIISKLAEDLSRPMIELGKEGTLLKMRLKEIIHGVEKETELVIKDYTELDLKRSVQLLGNLTYDEVLEEVKLSEMLGYNTPTAMPQIRGWRLLSKTGIPEFEVAALLAEFKNLKGILSAETKDFHSVFDEQRAHVVEEELKKLKKGF